MRPVNIGAALAFYSLLSLAPIVVLSISLEGLIFGGTPAEERVIQEVGALAGPDASYFLQSMSKQARKPGSGAAASLLGFITLLMGASGVLVELRSALNTMWDVHSEDAGGVLAIIKDRLLSVGMLLAIGFLLVVSLVVSAFLAAAEKILAGVLPAPIALLASLNFMISLAGITTRRSRWSFSASYPTPRLLGMKLGWVGRPVLFSLPSEKSLYWGRILGRAAVGSLYGAGASVVVVAVWVYYSAQLFLFGAEFTRVYGQHRLRTGSEE